MPLAKPLPLNSHSTLHHVRTGVYDEACEVLFDADFPGGTDLNGRVKGNAGAHVPRDLLLNLSRPATVPLAKAQVKGCGTGRKV